MTNDEIQLKIDEKFKRGNELLAEKNKVWNEIIELRKLLKSTETETESDSEPEVMYQNYKSW